MSQTGGNQNGLDMVWYLVPEPKMKMVVMDKKKGTAMPMARDLRALCALALLAPCLVMVVLIGLVGMGGMFKGGCSPLDGHDTDDLKQSTADMTAFQVRFQTMSDSIVSKIDEMGNRIDELENSINDLRVEMGVDGLPSPLAPSKPKVDTKSGDDSAKE
ncbi:hypothetical protein ACLB2K_039983 [Fragaria x ananassa]